MTCQTNRQRRADLSGHPVLLLAIFTCTFFYYRDFGARMIYGYLALGLFFALHLLDRLRRDEPLGQTPITLAAAALALVVLLQFLRPDARRDEDTLSYLISMLICIAYVLAAPARDRSVLLAGKTMYWSSVAMAAFVVVFTFLPELFLSLVYPHLSTIAQSYYDFFAPLTCGLSWRAAPDKTKIYKPCHSKPAVCRGGRRPISLKIKAARKVHKCTFQTALIFILARLMRQPCYQNSLESG